MLNSRKLEKCTNGDRVRVAGLVAVRQMPPTAKGFVFITLEDEEGLINVIVRPNVFQDYRDALRSAPLVVVEGRVQRQGRLLNVLAERAAALPAR